MNLPQRSSRANGQGFTLLELIIVIGIFALLAAMAYGGLSSVLNSRAKIEAQMAETAQYQKVFLRMRQDFQNAAKRTVRDNDGNLLSALSFDSYTHRLEFTHGGWTNPLNFARTGFERVAYRLEDGKLIRSSWRVLDRAPQTEAVDVTLLDDVDSLTWRFMDDSLQPSDSWPKPQLNGPALPVPLAVELKMTTRDWGDLRFLFKLGFDPCPQGQTTC